MLIMIAINMDDRTKEQDKPNAAAARRRVGRPTTLESGGASLAAILTLVRNGVATTRLDIESARPNSDAPWSPTVWRRWSVWV